MDQQTTRVLLADNPWLTGAPLEPWFARFLPERYVERDLRLQPDHRVCLVVGPRQAGKSTLIWKTLADAGEPGLHLNCEEPSVRHWLRSPAAFLADVAERVGEVPTLFFEEIQRLPEAGLFLKGVVDRRPGKRIFATGSSSFDLEARTRESLAGRARRHLLLPLSLAEMAASSEGAAPLVREAALAEGVDQALRHGGYPTVFGAEQPHDELAGLVEAFVVRDASDRFRLRHPAALRKLLELAASQVGNLVNYSEWAALCRVSNDTVATYARLLEETHIIRLVRPFVGGKRAEITSTPKVFFVDNGVRNQVFGGFGRPADRADHGALLENLIFTELHKTLNPLLDGLKFWRSKSGAEVDFVIERQGRLAGCEVKAGDCRGRVTRAGRSFIDAYQPDLFVVVNRGPAGERCVGDTPVVFIRHWELSGLLRERFA